jgi:hypothetical protein
MVTIVRHADEKGDWISCSIVLLVGVELELLAPVATPATMPLSWDFSAYRLVSFGGIDQRQTEQSRNRRYGRLESL